MTDFNRKSLIYTLKILTAAKAEAKASAVATAKTSAAATAKTSAAKAAGLLRRLARGLTEVSTAKATAFIDARKKQRVNVGDNTALSNSDVVKELIELLVIANAEHKVARDNASP
jgi:hypothetical protein